MSHERGTVDPWRPPVGLHPEDDRESGFACTTAACSTCNDEAAHGVLEQLARTWPVNAPRCKDLSHFGSYGTARSATTSPTCWSDRQRLNVDRDWPCVIVGAGSLGSALATFAGFTSRGFTVVGVLDVDQPRSGDPLGSLTVRHQDDLGSWSREGVAIGIVAVPPVAAREAADRLVESASPRSSTPRPCSTCPDRVRVRDVDLAVELQILAFHGEDPSRRVGPTRTAG